MLVFCSELWLRNGMAPCPSRPWFPRSRLATAEGFAAAAFAGVWEWKGRASAVQRLWLRSEA